MLDHLQLTLIHGSNIPGSYVIMFFTAPQFTFTTRHIYHWCHFCFCPAASFFLKLLAIALHTFPWFDSWVREMSWRRIRLPIPVFLSFASGSAGKESACKVGDLGLIQWVGKIPWRREQLPTPVFWPREFHGLYSPWGCKELDTTERLSHTYA